MSNVRKQPFQGENFSNTNEAKTYKKPFQTVDHPITTDHDINDEYLADPPQNVTGRGEIGGTELGMKANRKDEVDLESGAMGEEVLGRKHVDRAQEELIDESETSFRPGIREQN